MFFSEIYSEFSALNLVRMHWSLAFLSDIVYEVTVAWTQCKHTRAGGLPMTLVGIKAASNAWDAAYCNRWSRSVMCVSQFASLFVMRLRFASMAKRIEVLFECRVSGTFRNIVLDWSPDFPTDSMRPSTNFFGHLFCCWYITCLSYRHRPTSERLTIIAALVEMTGVVVSGVVRWRHHIATRFADYWHHRVLVT